ncbi:MAG: HAD family hydrolase [Planctomycetota bacterium]
MHRTMLLFDIDGTLMDAAGAGREAFHRAAQSLFGDALDFQGIATAGRLDNEIFAEAAERAGWTEYEDEHARLREHYPGVLTEELELRRDRVRALPGVHALLDELESMSERQEHGPVLGCLTGNLRMGAHVKLNTVGIDPARFSVTAFGDEALTRPDLTSLAMRRYESLHGHAPAPERVVVIGDTPHDVDCARAHGCVALAVATGRFDRQQLTEAGADIVIDDLSDASVVLDLVR